MDQKVFLGEKAKTQAENKLLKFVVGAIGATVLINTLLLVTVMKHERTILVPAGLNSRVKITDGTASDDYLKMMTRYVMGLALNYTPTTAREQFSDLLGLYSSDAFPAAKKMFYNLADTVETAQVSSSFYIQGIKVYMDKNIIEVTGLKREFAQDGSALNGSQQSTYELCYRISNGQFMLTGFSAKGGSK